jgi:hypothetical protein
MASISALRRFHRTLLADRAAALAAAPETHTPRQVVLVQSGALALYLPKLDRQFDQLDAIPGAYSDTSNVALLLAHEDGLFDGTYGGLYFQVESYLRVPVALVNQDVKDAALRIRAQIVPSMGATQGSYPSEAAIAEEIGKKLPALEADLAMLPVAGGTCADWARAIVASGGRIDALVAQRAEGQAEGEVDRTPINRIRARLVRTLNHLRTALRDEAEDNEALANAEALIFGHLDALTA